MIRGERVDGVGSRHALLRHRIAIVIAIAIAFAFAIATSLIVDVVC